MMRDVELEILCDDNRLVGGAVVPEDPRGVVLLLHGIPSVMPSAPGDRGYPGLAERFAERGWIAAWVDMRAVRNSPGHFSIEGWVRDATTALESAMNLPEASGLPAAIVGSSAGGAVASVAIHRGAPARALATLGSPSAWVSFAGHAHEGVRRITEEAGMAVAPEVVEDPTEWAAEFERVSTREVVADLDIPILVVHGTADDVVPVEHADEIASAAPDARKVILEGAPHQLRHVPEAVDAVLDWLDEVLG